LTCLSGEWFVRVGTLCETEVTEVNTLHSGYPRSDIGTQGSQFTTCQIDRSNLLHFHLIISDIKANGGKTVFQVDAKASCGMYCMNDDGFFDQLTALASRAHDTSLNERMIGKDPGQPSPIVRFLMDRVKQYFASELTWRVTEAITGTSRALAGFDAGTTTIEEQCDNSDRESVRDQ
jgi:hypothetical protein